MEFLSKKLREVDFSEKLRGFNKDEVDEFLEQAAVEASVLEEKLARAQELALELEEKLKAATANKPAVQVQKAVTEKEPAKPVAVIDDRVVAEKMSKTLMIAQKTADEIVAQAQNQAHAMVTAAENDAKRLEVEVKRSIQIDVNRLREVKVSLENEINELTELIAKERDELAGSLSHLADWVRSHLSSAKIESIMSRSADETIGSDSSADESSRVSHDVTKNGPCGTSGPADSTKPADISIFSTEVNDSGSTNGSERTVLPKAVNQNLFEQSLNKTDNDDDFSGGNVRIVEYHTFEVPKIQG